MVLTGRLPHPPPPPLEYIRGPLVCSHFLGKGGIFGHIVSERFPEKAKKKEVICVIANRNQYPR